MGAREAGGEAGGAAAVGFEGEGEGEVNTPSDLHPLWCALTGQQLNPPWVWDRLWVEFAKRFTADDLITVVRHMQRRNKQMEGAKFGFNVKRVCGDLEHFGSLLAEVRALQRNQRKPPTSAEKVLARWRGRLEPKQEKLARPVIDVLRAIVEQRRPDL